MASFATDDNMAEKAPRLDSFYQHPGPSSKDCQPTVGTDNPTGERGQSCRTDEVDIDMDEFMDNYLRNKDYLQHPEGWARFATFLDQFSNGDNLPFFPFSAMRLILHRGARCAVLEKQLIEFDQKNKSHLRGLTQNQKSLPGQPAVQNDYDDLMDELEHSLLKFHKAVSMYRDIKKLHPVPLGRYQDMMQTVIGRKWFEKEAYVLFGAHEDFFTVSEPLLPKLFDAFLHSKYSRWLVKMLSSIGDDSHSRLLRKNTVELLLKIGLILTALLILFIPLGFLFLGDFTKPQSFGLITGFAFLFSIVMMLNEDGDMHKTLIGVCAFSAVLFTISAQFTGTNP
ncbi:hypothetical protein B0H66DRAFT_163957 [Apodospora peruviana]|uniref:DUF6594 domain-containing protein n=1 Tax=Apodospora peruviana TaxID=516989 RepID=A0AAE0IJY9_9PEZI|nr:hypothetical protein B0H66DRAFT_163957 [Apodospora peruviana]